MKTLKQRKAWKILVAIMIVLLIAAAVVFFVCTGIAKKQNKERENNMIAAITAGYDLEIQICNKVGDIRIDGVDYILYSRHYSSFVEGQSRDNFVIRKDAEYIDDANGQTKEVVIYGKVAGTAKLPDEMDTAYYIIEPYRFIPYEEGLDMWAVAGLLALALFIEWILFNVLLIYFVVYAIKRNKIKKLDYGTLRSFAYHPGYCDMNGENQYYILNKNDEGKWVFVSKERKEHSEPQKVITYSVSDESVAELENFMKENFILNLTKRPSSKEFITDFSPWNYDITFDRSAVGGNCFDSYSIFQYKVYSESDRKLLKTLNEMFFDLKGEVISETEEK